MKHLSYLKRSGGSTARGGGGDREIPTGAPSPTDASGRKNFHKNAVPKPRRAPAIANHVQKNAAGDAILTSQQKEILAGVERQAPSKLRVFLRAYSGVATKRQAIQAKCLDCSNLTVAEVRLCTATGCPLWKYRPYVRKENHHDR